MLAFLRHLLKAIRNLNIGSHKVTSTIRKQKLTRRYRPIKVLSTRISATGLCCQELNEEPRAWYSAAKEVLRLLLGRANRSGYFRLADHVKQLELDQELAPLRNRDEQQRG
jgi:hypothetical protein